MARKIAGRTLGLIIAIALTIGGAAIVLFAAKLSVYLSGDGLMGILTWFLTGAFGLAIGSIGVLGLLTSLTGTKARH